jgi:hypothetical protein
MGSAFVDYYCRIKEAEVERYKAGSKAAGEAGNKAAGEAGNKDSADDREVSEWEHREYFDLL